MADPWHQAPVQVAMTTYLRVVRLNGELLEVSLTPKEAKQIKRNRDLKRCLAKHEATKDLGSFGMPFVILWLRLIHRETSVEVDDRDQVNWEWVAQACLQYVVVDAMSSALAELPPGEDLMFCYEDVCHLLDPKLMIPYVLEIWNQRGQAFCKHLVASWTSTILSLPSEVVDDAESPFGKELLHRCFSLLLALEKAEGLLCAGAPTSFRHWSYDALDDMVSFLHTTFTLMTIELVKQKMDVRTVQTSCDRLGREKVKRDVWQLVGQLRDGLGADLAMALIDKGLPRWCWAGHWGPWNENLLQSFMAPFADLPDLSPGDQPTVKLCAFLAGRLSLQELCHQDARGKIAYYYADLHWDLVPVRNVIKEQMERGAREFRGSLLALIELTRSVRKDCGSLGPLPAFEEQLWQKAAAIREEWSSMGWRFAEHTTSGQISEVLTWHFQAVGRGAR